MKSKVGTITKTVFLTFAVMSLLIVSIPTVSAKTLKFNETIYALIDYNSDLPPFWIDPDPHMPGIQPQTGAATWCGPLTGDINAISYFWETDKNYLTGVKGGKGGIEHFFEDFIHRGHGLDCPLVENVFGSVDYDFSSCFSYILNLIKGHL